MYTSYIGGKFLKLFNQKEGTDYSAETFFDNMIFPLFFDDEKHLMHVGNSAFFQKPKATDVEIFGTRSKAQFNNLKVSIESDEANMSIMVGAAAKDLQGTTSGQISNINYSIDSEEMYASWFGQALGIGVSGGYVILMNEPEIQWFLFQGWKVYRKYIEQTPSVKDRQIETWNGQWLSLLASNNFNVAESINNLQIETTEVQGSIAIPTKQWSNIVFSISKLYPKRAITGYCYNLSQTNTTFGFINFILPDIRKFYELRDKLFINEESTILGEEEIESLSTFYNFKNACKLGTIGLKAIEPAKLREYMPSGSVLYAQGKDFKFNNNESYKQYQLFKIWIIAMLNKTELLKLASSLAQSLMDFEAQEERGKKVFSTLSKEVRGSKNLKHFIDKITDILPYVPSKAGVFESIVEEVLKMPSDNFPLFITLIRFEYAIKKSK